MKYGLPYKGSKNKLAERIVRLLPKRTNLIDLFCGGCAVSHAALLMKKYGHIHINDINWMCPTLFIDALSGKYNNENRWISREDFFRLKDTDPYVAVVWSFGNNLRDYLYSREIEPLKKAIHYAIFFSDYSLGKELGHDLSFIDSIGDIRQRYLAAKRHFRLQSFEGGGGRCKSHTLLGRNGSATYGGGQTLPITSSVLDYAEVEIPQNSVIYCDIPYENTNGYDKKKSGFDHERFYQWAEHQTEPVFISSYQMPADRFDCIVEFNHRSTMCAAANNLVTERIFVPKHQKERGYITKEWSLFD